jgi:hypothetical protein
MEFIKAYILGIFQKMGGCLIWMIMVTKLFTVAKFKMLVDSSAKRSLLMKVIGL